MEKRITVSISEGVADVRLVRADKMNALDAAMFDALVATTDRLAHEKGLRAGLVGDDSLRELTYTGRIFSAQEGMSYGLATRICDDPRAAAFEVAREIAGKSPEAIRAAKRMLNNLSVDPGPALSAESVEQMKLMGGANQLEAVRANIDKRAPRFADV